MADNISNFIINARLNNQISSEAKRIITDHSAMRRELEKPILAPSGKPAAQQLALSTPAVLRTAEQKAALRGVQTPSIITTGLGYYPSSSSTASLISSASQEAFLKRSLASKKGWETRRANIAASLSAKSSTFDIQLNPPGKEILVDNGTFDKTAESLKKLDEKFKLGLINTKQYNAAIYKLTGDTKGFKEQTVLSELSLGKLAIRAAATIPIWLALRSVMMGVISTIQEGVKYLIDFDKEIARIKNVMPGINVEGFKDMARTLSAETGKNISEVADAFYRFADAGLDAEISMAGMNTAVKASVAFFADTKETAKILADMYVMLGDRITEVSGAQNKMNYIMSTIAVLQKTNKFELGEFTEGLKTFASTAQAANLTIDQMTFLLAKTHTYMQRGSSGGNQLTRAFQSLEKNMDKVRVKFPELVDPSNMDRFELLMKVLEEFNKDFEGAGVVFGEIADIFELRASKSVNALVTQFKAVNAEWERLKKLSPEDRMKVLAEQTKNATNTLENQLKIMTQLRNQISGTFITSAAGAIDFNNALEKINKTIKGLIPLFDALGVVVHQAMATALLGPTGGFLAFKKSLENIIDKSRIAKSTSQGNEIDKLTNVIQGKSQIKETRSTLQDLITGKYDKTLTEQGLNKQRVMEAIVKVLKEQESIEIKIAKNNQEQVKTLSDISKMYEYQAAMLERFQAYGYSNIEIEKMRLALMIENNKKGDRDNEIYEQRLKIVKMTVEEINKLSATLSGSIQTGIEGILAGTSSIGDMLKGFNTTVQDTFRSQIAKGMTSRIMQSGIGDMFGQMGVNLEGFFSGKKTGGLIGGIEDGFANGEKNIRTGFEYGANLTYKQIVKGFEVGANKSVSTTAEGTKNQTTNLTGDILGSITKLTSGSGGFDSFLSSIFGAKKTGAIQGPVTEAQFNAGQTTLGTGQTGGGFSDFASSIFGQGGKGSNILGIGQGGIPGGGASGGSFMQNMGSMAGGAMSVAGFAQALGSSYKAKGSGNPWGSAMNLGMSGAMAGMAVGGPIGAAIGAVIGGTVGFVQGAKSKTTEEWATTTNQITSKIDVTNNHLEYVNRNLVALRNDIRTFMLPTSAYFSTKASLEDQFSISSKRGIQ